MDSISCSSPAQSVSNADRAESTGLIETIPVQDPIVDGSRDTSPTRLKDPNHRCSPNGNDGEITEDISEGDRNLARTLQREEDRKARKQNRKDRAARRRAEREDQRLAEELQKQDLAGQRAVRDREQKAMMETNTGRAVLAVEGILEAVETLAAVVPGSSRDRKRLGLRAVARDDMVVCAERFVSLQAEFRVQGLPHEVDIGYHYTDEESMGDIQANGLMTRKDRTDRQIDTESKGDWFGDGIYTANNPTSFMRFGKVGLIVARLQGKTVRVPYSKDEDDSSKPRNTVVGDKSARSLSQWPATDDQHEIVLQASSQCLPLVRFRRKPLASKLPRRSQAAHESVLAAAAILKGVLDELFNDRPHTQGTSGASLDTGNKENQAPSPNNSDQKGNSVSKSVSPKGTGHPKTSRRRLRKKVVTPPDGPKALSQSPMNHRIAVGRPPKPS